MHISNANTSSENYFAMGTWCMAAFQNHLFAMAAEVRKAGMDGDPRPFSASLAEAAAGGGRGGVVTS